jgi:hypothetical protein
LYDYKIAEINENQTEANKIEQEYHLGVMDPARIVARIEKQSAIKKNIGTKAKINEMLRKNDERNHGN